MPNKTFQVLSIEDNEPDFDLLKKALLKIPNISLDITHIVNGQTAVDYIFKKGKFKDSVTPDLIILDINLPKINGYEILKKIKKSKKYKSIPVIMFSTSSLEEDIKKSYEAHANSYVIKSFEVQTLFQKIAIMGEYWLKTSEIPKQGSICIIKEEQE